jgi:hypothetical protein
MKKSNLVPHIEGSSDLNRAYKGLFQQNYQKLSVKQRVWVRIPACPNRGVGVWCNGSIKKVNLDAQILCCSLEKGISEGCDNKNTPQHRGSQPQI